MFPNKITTLCLAVVVMSSILMGCSVADQIDVSACRAGSQKLINWDQRPVVENGYLTMRGTTKGDAQIHDPLTARRTGTNWAAFVLNDLYETSEETYRLKAVGSIYPAEMRSRLASLMRDGKPRLLAETYDVTATSFDVRVKIPDSLLDLNLVVSVWDPDVGKEGNRAIGAECVDR